jgi:spore coat protein U-like protein
LYRVICAYRSVFAALLGVALAIVAAPAAEARNCDFQLQNIGDVTWRGGSNAGYEVYDPRQYTLAVDFSVKVRKSGCAFFVTATSASSSNSTDRALVGSLQKLPYQIYRDGSLTTVLKDVPQAGPNDVLPGPVSKADETYSFRFVLAIPALQVVIPDTYRDTIAIRVYEGTVADASLEAQAQIQFTAAAPSTVDFSFNNDTSFSGPKTSTLDLGDLSTGTTGSMTVRARGNGGFWFSMQSQNGGVLRNASGMNNDAISYVMKMNNIAVPLGSGPANFLGALLPTSPQGISYKLDVTVGDTSSASAGTYSDVVQITVTSLR